MSNIDEIIAGINKKFKDTTVKKGLIYEKTQRIDFSSPRANLMLRGGIPLGRITEFAGEESGGKEQPVDAKVITEFGFCDIGKIGVGDSIYCEDGNLHSVVGVFPQGKKQVFKISFSDGSFTRCGIEHLWNIQTRKQRYSNGNYSTVSLGFLMDKIKTVKDISIPISNPVKFPQKELKIEPLILGMLFSNEGFTTKSNNNPFKQLMKDIGFINLHNRDKFIPEEYKISSIEQRIRLLAGLINTDGHIYNTGTIAIYTNSNRLADDIMEIGQSLGLLPHKYSSFRGDSFEYEIIFEYTDLFTPYLSQKMLKQMPVFEPVKDQRSRGVRRIVSIDYVCDMECVCIKVDNPTHLYLTDNFIVTHNTSTALDIVSNAQTLFEERIKGKEILYVDTECTLDGDWAQKLGVDTSKLCIDQPDLEPAEKILQRVMELTETGVFGLVILDSIAALVPERRLKKDFDDKNKPGEFAALWTDFINQYFRVVTRTNTAFIAMNRPKPVIGGYLGQVYYPGGVDWKLACSVRILFSKGDCFNKDGKEEAKSYSFPVAQKIVMSLNKTKICPPDKKLTYYTLRFEKGLEGVDYVFDTVDLAVDFGLIEKGGSWYSYKDLKVQGLDKVRNYFRHNDDDFMEIYNQMMEIVKK